MDQLTFISSIWGSLAWPAVLIIGLVLFREPIKNAISKIKSIRIGNSEMELVEPVKPEPVKLTEVSDIEIKYLYPTDYEINIITSHLQRSPHSFQWFRDNTELQFSDKQFNTLIAAYNKILEPINIVSRNKKKRKKSSGLPGMRLTQKYRQEIERVLQSSV